jgi:DNA-binding NtrC family response regulator
MTSNAGRHALVVTQDALQAEEILDALRASGFSVTWAQDDEAAVNALSRGTVHALVTQVHAPRIDGLRLMAAARNHRPDTVVLLIARQEELDAAVAALQDGALDFQVPPLNLDRLVAIVEHGVAMQDLQFETQRLRRRLDARHGLGTVVGHSRAIEQAYEKIRQTAPSDTPIIVSGEPGTGKDRLAQAIHYASARSAAPMAKWICAKDTLPHAELELFGLAPDTPGLVALSEGGTLYLDGVGDLPGVLCDKLLSLQSLHRFERVGESESHGADVRLVFSFDPLEELGASTRDLLSELERRFHAVTIELPPLRERPEDIPILAEHFLQRHGESAGKPGLTLSLDAVTLLNQHSWPGNVRELSAVVQGMVVSADDGVVLSSRHIPHSVTEALGAVETHVQIPVGLELRDVERIVIETTMERCGGDKVECARILGIGLRTLYRKLKEYEAG